MIEGDTDQGVDVQFSFENTPRKVHSGIVKVPTLWVDKYPVTNDKFAKFLEIRKYLGKLRNLAIPKCGKNRENAPTILLLSIYNLITVLNQIRRFEE